MTSMVLKFTREEIFYLFAVSTLFTKDLDMVTSMLMQQRLLIRNRNKESKFSNRAPLMRCKFKLRTHHRLVQRAQLVFLRAAIANRRS